MTSIVRFYINLCALRSSRFLCNFIRKQVYTLMGTVMNGTLKYGKYLLDDDV